MAKLIREDGLIKEGIIEFIEFDTKGLGKNIHTYPRRGFICSVNRTSIKDCWFSSVITEVFSPTEFKTNFNYNIEI